MEKINKAVSVLLALAVFLIIITFSIGIPIYFRPFYYGQIEALDIPDETGFEYGEIKDAYDNLLDYLTLPGHEFNTGVFEYSAEGASHFADCKLLFNLNIIVFAVSLAIITAIMILKKLGIIKLWRPFGLDITLFSGAFTLIFFGILGLVIARDFDFAFQIFHQIFFPGKDNWLFDPRYDQIIMALPFEFFMNCAIAIITSMVIISVAFIISAVVRRQIDKARRRPKTARQIGK